jgi:hypothetical protein
MSLYGDTILCLLQERRNRIRFLPRRRALAAVFLSIGISCFMGSCRPAAPEKLIHVVFRLDDFSALSSADFEGRIIDAFRQAKASITIGVVPFDHTGSGTDPSSQDIVPLTPLKAAVKDGTVDIALHGYSHQAINAEPYSRILGARI